MVSPTQTKPLHSVFLQRRVRLYLGQATWNFCGQNDPGTSSEDFRLFPFSIIPPAPHTHISFTYHPDIWSYLQCHSIKDSFPFYCYLYVVETNFAIKDLVTE